MSYWEKKSSPKPWEQLSPEPMVLDEQVMAVLQEDPEVDLFEEEEEDTTSLMVDANLRLEQGRLYQMILQNNIFADTNADLRAIKNVQREIRKFVRERMETMLGIRQEQSSTQTIVSSPFNDLEVTALKMVASKVTKGATEVQQPQQQAPAPPTPPKKDGITAISGNLRPSGTAAVKPQASASNKPMAVKSQPKSAINSTSESALQKPIEEMTQEELLAHNNRAEERSKRNYAAMPNNLVPHPSQQQLEAMYTVQAHDRLTQHAQKMSLNR